MKNGLNKKTEAVAKKRLKEALGIIKSLRRFGITIGVISHRSKISRITIHYWQEGRFYPSEQHLKKLQKYFLGFYRATPTIQKRIRRKIQKAFSGSPSY